MASKALISGKAASLEAAFGESLSQLFKTVKDVMSNKAGVFQNNLEGIETTLRKAVEKMGPMVNELDRTGEETERLIEQMKKGEKLVRKCLKINRWNIYARAQHSRKLTELAEALARYFMIDIKAQVLKLGLETFVLRGFDNNDIPPRLDLTHAWSSCAVPPPPNFIVGLDVPLKELKVALLKEEVSSLVLSAPGGCGKTTLVKMLARDQEIRGIFGDNIMFVHVSKTPNFEVIARRLFQHECFQAREFPSDEQDAIFDEIGQLLNQTKAPILLILDDVWRGSEHALEKLKSHTPNYKILVTSRSSELPMFGALTYKLRQLNDKDATTLFLHYATLQDSSPDIVPVGDDIVEKIVKFCGGVPLALTTIGRSLCGEDAAVWQSKVLEWSSGHSILDSNRGLLERLKKSLEFSEVIMKECFMDLGSFPENQRIHVATLIDMWEELYQLDSIKAIDTLHEISARNLASLQVTWQHGNEFEGCSDDFVLQHDLLRELAIHQSSQEPIEQRKRLIFDISGKILPKWWTEQKQLPISARLLSISTDKMFSSSWCNILPAQVEVLVLNFQANNYTFPMFLERMDKLKVLIVTQNGISPAEVSDFQLLGSVPNLKIIRLEKISIPSLCKTLVELKSLKKISLFMCDIGQAFSNCTYIQVSDALPNLTDINIEYCNDLVELPAGLCDIIHLKKLSISNCHKLSALSEGIGKLRNLEVLRLRSCSDLLELPESIRSLHNLSILGISDCLNIIKLPEHIGDLINLKELHMDGCSSLGDIPLPESIMNLKQLELVVCDEVIKAKFWEPIKGVLTNVEIAVTANDHINSRSFPSPS